MKKQDQSLSILADGVDRLMIWPKELEMKLTNRMRIGVNSI